MIEPVSEEDLEEVLPLIEQYQQFYQVKNISTSRNREFFSQFNEANPFGCQFAYRESGKVIGFATVYFTFTSTIAAKVAVLNDLYICPDHRGKGIARKLIEHCRSFADQNGAARLQWVTAPSNETAQKLYDSLDTGKSTWHFYTYNT
ncbi:GNAT family N-acetyltransferase [Parahaliea mediterranea]|uniref:GNAT family N-acetyltransferase n=1 Tax=Parahaliea mediterranea TaxID=651086 RepID=A0A939DI58_9GAMM|nr:GNAT family N-acetyltransferase [Parahaliea mediterranea]